MDGIGHILRTGTDAIRQVDGAVYFIRIGKEDLAEMSGIGALFYTTLDIQGRPVMDKTAGAEKILPALDEAADPGPRPVFYPVRDVRGTALCRVDDCPGDGVLRSPFKGRGNGKAVILAVFRVTRH